MKRKKGSELVRMKATKSREDDGSKKKVVPKGKKKLKADPVFDQEELPDLDNEGSDEIASGGGSSGDRDNGSSDGGSESGDVEEDESDEVQEEEPGKEGWEGLLLKLLQDKIGSGKRKGGPSVKSKGKEKHKVKKTKGEMAIEKGVVVKT